LLANDADINKVSINELPDLDSSPILTHRPLLHPLPFSPFRAGLQSNVLFTIGKEERNQGTTDKMSQIRLIQQ
jgi:hypothetical protein